MRSKAFAPYGGRAIPIALPALRAAPPNKRPLPTPQRSRRTPLKLTDHANKRATISAPSLSPQTGRGSRPSSPPTLIPLYINLSENGFLSELPVGARQYHSKARQQPALQRPAREPLGAQREGFGGEPKLLRRPPRLHRQR